MFRNGIGGSFISDESVLNFDEINQGDDMKSRVLKFAVLAAACAMLLACHRKVSHVTAEAGVAGDVSYENICSVRSSGNFEGAKVKAFGDLDLLVSGKCSGDRKHGQFNYYNADTREMIMKTKFNKDVEIKTDCVSNPPARRISQKECFELYLKNRTTASEN